MHKVSASTKNDRTSKSNNSEMINNRLIGRVTNEIQKLYKRNMTLKLGVLCFDSYSHSAYIGLQEMDNVLYSVVFYQQENSLTRRGVLLACHGCY